MEEPLQLAPEINKLFLMLKKQQGLDVILRVGSPPLMKVRGEFRK